MQHSHEALDRPGGFSRVNLLAPLRHRDFRLLWAGMTVSLLGDGIFLVAMAWQAYELWNAPAALSLLGIGMTVPMIAFLLPGGCPQRPARPALAHAVRGRSRARSLSRSSRSSRSPASLHLLAARRARRAATASAPPSSRPPSRRSCRTSSRRRPGSRKLARSVRPADRVSTCGPGARRRARSRFRAGVAFAVDAASFVVSAGRRAS